MNTLPTRDWWAGRQVCVTGGSGLIGRSVIERLSLLGPARIASFGRTSAVDTPRTVVSMTGDVCDPVSVAAAVNGCSVVIHLAANKRRSGNDGADHTRPNVDGTGSVLRACAAAGVEVILYTSTAYVYAQDDRSPIDETQPTAHASSYASSKLAAERLMQQHAQRQGARILIARLANVYGSEPDPDTVIGRGVRQALETAIVFRDLSPVRDFIHVRDAAEALVRLAPHAAADCPIVNVGTGVGTSVREVAEIVADWAARTHDRPRIEAERHHSPAYMDRLVLDNRRLHALTGWSPEIPLTEGVNQALEQLYRTPVRQR